MIFGISRKFLLLGKILTIFDRREKLRLAALLAMMVAGAALETLGIGVVASFVAVISKPDLLQSNAILRALYGYTGARTGADFVTYMGFTLCVIFVAKNAFLAWLSYRQVKFAYDKEVRLSQQLFVTYITNPYTFHMQRNSADLLKNLTTEVSHVITGIVMPALTVVAEVAVLLFIVALLATAQPLLAAATLIGFGAVATIFNHVAKPHILKLGIQRSRYSGSRIQLVNQSLGSIKEIKLLGAEAFFANTYYRHTLDYTHAGLVHHSLHAMPRLIVETLAVLAILISAIVGQTQEHMQNLLPVIALFALAAMRIMPSFTKIAPALNQIRYYHPALHAVERDLRDPAMDPELALPAKDRREGRFALRAGITVRNVCYAYPGSNGPSIHDVSLFIPRGASVAFMGASGAGKSTLVDLILGLIEPSAGEIMIDDQPLRELAARWQRCIGYVPQSIYIFDDSVRRNIALGLKDEEIDDERVWSVLRSARLDGLVRELPRQLDTVLGERGIRISGGERQRIGIARALYHDPEVIVFDEATSALDGATERAISETINELMGDKTVLLVAHRISTVQQCDVVYFLKDGKLMDQASFQELVRRNKSFRATLGAIDSEEHIS